MQDETLPLAAKADLWRQKVIAGTITDEELKEAVELLREGRRLAAETGTARKAASAKAPARDVAAILSQLLGPKPEAE